MGPKQQVRGQEKDNQNHDINENGDIDEVERLKQKLRESENQRNVLENRLRQNEEKICAREGCTPQIASGKTCCGSNLT